MNETKAKAGFTQLVILQPGEHHKEMITLGRLVGTEPDGKEIFAGVARICVSRTIQEAAKPSQQEQDWANLFAAAPAMYEALLGIRDLAKYGEHGFGPDIIKICDTALAQAQGQS